MTRSALETLARPLWMDVPSAEALVYARMTVVLQGSRAGENVEQVVKEASCGSLLSPFVIRTFPQLWGNRSATGAPHVWGKQNVIGWLRRMRSGLRAPDQKGSRMPALRS